MCPNDAIQTTRDGFVCLQAPSFARLLSFEGGDKMKVSQITRKSLSIFDYRTTAKSRTRTVKLLIKEKEIHF